MAPRGAAATAVLHVILPVALGLLATSASALDCGTADLLSQADVDKVVGCQSVGDLQISGDLRDLGPLKGLARIRGGLRIVSAERLTSLAGLEGVVSIGMSSSNRSLYIKDSKAFRSLAALCNVAGPLPGSITVIRAPSLASLDGLQGVTSLGMTQIMNSLWLQDVATLQSVSALSNVVGRLPGSIVILNAPKLASLDGLEGITSLGMNNKRNSLYLRVVTALTSLSALRNVVALQGSLYIRKAPNLTSLDGLERVRSVGGNIILQHIYSVQSLSGLRSIAGPLPGGLNIARAPILRSLSGLEGITSIGLYITLINIAVLESVSALRSVTGAVPNGIEIKSAPCLLTLQGLEGITASSGLTVAGADALQSLRGVEGLTHLSFLTVSGNMELRSLVGLNAVQVQVGNVRIVSNPKLRSLHGLEGVSLVKALTVTFSDALESLSGLANLGSVDGVVTVTFNPVLTSLQPLPRLGAVDRFMLIPSNGLECFTDAQEAKLRAATHGKYLSDIPTPVWNDTRCHACDPPCGSSRGRLIDCDYVSGRCRCPLGFVGPQCSSLAAKVFVEAGQSLECAWRDDEAAGRVCDLSVGLRKEQQSASEEEPTSFSVYVSCGKPSCGTSDGPLGVTLSAAAVAWTNETHGALQAKLFVESRIHYPGDTGISLVVGYHEHLYPDSLLQGTLLDASAAWPLYPWCLDSGECRRHSNITVQVVLEGEGVHCTVGQIVDGLVCRRCPAGSVALPGDTRCSVCGRWRHADASQAYCSLRWSVITLVAGGLCALTYSLFCVCLQIDIHLIEWSPRCPRRCVTAVRTTAKSRSRERTLQRRSSDSSPGSDSSSDDAYASSSGSSSDGDLLGSGADGGGSGKAARRFACRVCRPRLLGRRLMIEDVSLEQGHTVLKTTRQHWLNMWGSTSISIAFEGTKHPQLDTPCSQFRARVTGPDRLEILDELGQSLAKRLDTSTGVSRLSLARTLWHTTYTLPVAFIGPCAFAVALACMDALGSYKSKDVDHSYMDVIALICFAATGIAIAATIHQRWKAARSPLEHDILRYRETMRRWRPDVQPCAKGPGRAIEVGALLDFYDYFSAYIRDRTMYYVVSNIVYPLTLPSKLSFAELAGPGDLDWFVSHFWGHPFQDLCSSVQKHAQVVRASVSWQTQRYWICSFSNNQHRVLEELGRGWAESSFYLALLSPTRRGTCLVVDAEALPLTRSWCLFEIAQTVELERKSVTGPTDLSFCTGSGVVNEGNASVEVSLGLAKRLSTLSLQDASASDPNDQAMIDEFVESEMGGFEVMNHCVRERIALALHKAQEVVLGEFQQLQATLTKRGGADPEEKAQGPSSVPLP